MINIGLITFLNNILYRMPIGCVFFNIYHLILFMTKKTREKLNSKFLLWDLRHIFIILDYILKYALGKL